MQDKPDFADQLLQASLAQHASEEPRLGLEGRILAGVTLAVQARRRREWAWGLAASTLAIVAVMAALQLAKPRAAKPGPAPLRAAAAPAPAQPAPVKLIASRPRASRLRLAERTPPRARQFPTAAPLSRQEKLLVRYVELAPNLTLQKPVTPSTSEPVEIPEIRFAALHIKALPETPD